MNYSTETLSNDKTIILILAIIIGFFLIVTFYINSYLPFKKERDYIKMEIKRSCDEEEYLHWKKELKKLYIRKIPIVRSIVNLKHKR